MRSIDVYASGDASSDVRSPSSSSTWQKGRSSFSKSSLSRPAVSPKPSVQEQEQEEAYFTELLSYSLERLGKEPELLQADQDHLRKQAEESAVKHYKAFINTATCLENARGEMEGLAGHVDALLQDIPVLDRVCDQFVTTAKALQAKQAENKLLQSRHIMYPVLLHTNYTCSIRSHWGCNIFGTQLPQPPAKLKVHELSDMSVMLL